MLFLLCSRWRRWKGGAEVCLFKVYSMILITMGIRCLWHNSQGYRAQKHMPISVGFPEVPRLLPLLYGAWLHFPPGPATIDEHYPHLTLYVASCRALQQAECWYLEQLSLMETTCDHTVECKGSETGWPGPHTFMFWKLKPRQHVRCLPKLISYSCSPLLEGFGIWWFLVPGNIASDSSTDLHGV